MNLYTKWNGVIGIIIMLPINKAKAENPLTEKKRTEKVYIKMAIAVVKKN